MDLADTRVSRPTPAVATPQDGSAPSAFKEAKKVPPEAWPQQLTILIDDLRQRGHAPVPDIRDSDAGETTSQNDLSRNTAFARHWRMPADQAMVDAHVRAFDLEPAEAGDHAVSKMFLNFPKDWPKPAARHMEWHAWHYNRDDSSRLMLWFILAYDREGGMLYFYHQNYDVTA
ncbi:hypothetical protein LzC2_05730 [Planctomycetes bacterium LzC2]|uniref:Uncharacterized protein n=2 Tax=Alienimonas chondri TaxID=2681879 RepID=A0ABX1VAI5_9PLAN|nr:hypothetical protein [Alienimonas chondri]